jgi:archaeosine-15-forming tRNA-guanine transglycosylase
MGRDYLFNGILTAKKSSAESDGVEQKRRRTITKDKGRTVEYGEHGDDVFEKHVETAVEEARRQASEACWRCDS